MDIRLRYIIKIDKHIISINNHKNIKFIEKILLI